MSALEISDLEVRYGGIRAVKGVSLRVEQGELVCLIGANGAGKSSTLRALSGLAANATGKIIYQGRDIGALPAFERARVGLALVPEGRGVFAQLSVDENLRMGAYSRENQRENQRENKREDSSVDADLDEVFKLFPRLKERRGQTGGTLSGGEQQMLALGRALMGRPKLLMLDEPSMGLAPLVVRRIFDVIRDINARGVTVLLVEQNARAALALARRAYVMEGGLITLEGEARALLDDPKVREAYLGEGIAR
jgi:branched-chain amino acid transport system ATP-binding protein